jgi:Uma2 family endonuclease
MVVKTPRATLDDLAREPGKAELIGGRIVRYMATGRRPGRVARQILRSLADHADRTGIGEALGDNVGYAVPELASGRESFSPDASYYDGPEQADPMRFIEGPPTFAVEVRSENDYGNAAEAEMAAKREDYFAAGTKIVWDVDPVNNVIHCYRHDRPTQPTTFRPGDTADAEPAVPGWRVEAGWVLG